MDELSNLLPDDFTQDFFELPVGPEWDESQPAHNPELRKCMAHLREEWTKNWLVSTNWSPETHDTISPMKLEPFETHLQSKRAKQAEEEARLQAESQRAQAKAKAKAKAMTGLCRVCRAFAT